MVRAVVLGVPLVAVLANGAGCGEEASVEAPAAALAEERVAVAPSHWNLLIWVIDTARADHFGINGYERPTTPRLDALAASGVNFQTAITVAPRTWQSFSSILTGLYPPRHGVRYLYDHPIRPETPTLATLLQSRGYRTLAFDSSPFIRDMTASNGFDAQMHADTRLSKMSAVREALDENIGTRILSSAREVGARPWFFFVRLSGPHWEYNSNEWTPLFANCEGFDHSFNEGGYGRSMQLPGAGTKLEDVDGHKRIFWSLDVDERTLEHMVAHYDAKLRFTDELIGRTVSRMRDEGLLDRTVVIVTSDHGESFGEHGYWQHGPRVDDPVMRVPLMVLLPKDHPARREGRSVDDAVSVVDVLPTALDLVGIDIPSDVDGQSLVPLIEGETTPERWVYGEIGRSFQGIDPERYIAGVRGKHRMIRTREWKLVFVPRDDVDGGGMSRLYDLRADATESRDVASEHPEIVAKLLAHLDSVRAYETEEEEERRLTEAESQLLRELGYVE